MTGGLDRPFADGERAELIGELSAALDEVFRLRRALAYEATVLDANTDMQSFPRARRRIATVQVERMREAARGAAGHAYEDVHSRDLRLAMADADAPPTLTRAAFAAERNPR